MVTPHGILCEALICCLEEVGGHLQIALRRSNIDVAKVGGELRKQRLNVLTCPIFAVPPPDARPRCGEDHAGAGAGVRQWGKEYLQLGEHPETTR